MDETTNQRLLNTIRYELPCNDLHTSIEAHRLHAVFSCTVPRGVNRSSQSATVTVVFARQLTDDLPAATPIDQANAIERFREYLRNQFRMIQWDLNEPLPPWFVGSEILNPFT